MHYLDYSEKIQHGTPEFPIAYYYVDEKHPRYHMPMHWHRETELLRVLRGRLRLYVDNAALALEAGESLLIREGTLHGGTPENCVYECIVFDAKALLQGPEGCKQALRGLFDRCVYLDRAALRAQPGFEPATKALSAAISPGVAGRELAILGALYGLCAQLAELGRSADLAGRESRSPKAEQLKPVLEYIETHYGQRILLETLARQAGMSPKYFCRYFRAVVHRSPIDYLNYYRTECACSCLMNTDMTVAEIAYHCGFSDSSFFIRSFKKYQGMTPRQYRLGESKARAGEQLVSFSG